MVVGVQPGVKGGAAFGFGGVGAGVGPFVGEGAVEPFDFAVGLGPVGAGALVGDAQVRAGSGPVAGAVAATVVGEDALDGDPGGGVPGGGAGQERGRGFLALVGEDLGIGEPGVVVQDGVQIAVAQLGVAVAVAAGAGSRGPVLLALCAPGGAPATAVGDVAELLDVSVDELAGAVALVAADRDARAAV